MFRSYIMMPVFLSMRIAEGASIGRACPELSGIGEAWALTDMPNIVMRTSVEAIALCKALVQYMSCFDLIMIVLTS